ncbi:MAG: hypothetical protein GYB68_16970 [Chloroflexi bacterium]|nr:hypothetical protein [Chloroflexota bacterium]
MEETPAPIANIGPKGRRNRMMLGITLIAIGIGLSIFFVVLQVQPVLRLVTFVPFWSGFLGVFQSRSQTDVALASKGQRNMDDGPQDIAIDEDKAKLRAQALRVYIEAATAGAALTGLVMLV